MKRTLVWLLAIAVWGALLGGGLAWDGREVAVPEISNQDVQTAIPDSRRRPMSFPRSTLPPTWQPAFPHASPDKD